MENSKNYSFPELEKIEGVYQKHLSDANGKLLDGIGSTQSVWALLNAAEELKIKPSEVAGCRKLYQDYIRGKAPKPEEY
jgi:hypothetical protein